MARAEGSHTHSHKTDLAKGRILYSGAASSPLEPKTKLREAANADCSDGEGRGGERAIN